MPSTYTTATATGGAASVGTSPPSESGSGHPSGREASHRKTKTNLETLLRVIQFSLSLAVIGLYGQDIHPHAEHGPRAPPKWVFAVVVGFLGAVFSFGIIAANILLKRKPLALRPSARMVVFGVEGLLVVLWLVVFGVFGGVYINKVPAEESWGGSGGKVKRMKRAVWVDVAVLGFGVVLMVWMGGRWMKGRKGEKMMEDEEGKEME